MLYFSYLPFYYFTYLFFSFTTPRRNLFHNITNRKKYKNPTFEILISPTHVNVTCKFNVKWLVKRKIKKTNSSISHWYTPIIKNVEMSVQFMYVFSSYKQNWMLELRPLEKNHSSRKIKNVTIVKVNKFPSPLEEPKYELISGNL